jgi:hypothetical protein
VRRQLAQRAGRFHRACQPGEAAQLETIEIGISPKKLSNASSSQ